MQKQATPIDPEGAADRSRQRYTILLPGIPVSSTRGALGWSTVALIETGGLRILFDTGSYGDRSLLIERLLSLDPQALDAVFISHLHYDHCQNIDLFADIPLFAKTTVSGGNSLILNCLALSSEMSSNESSG